MAQKPQRRIPKVPRSFIKSTPGINQSSVSPTTSTSSDIGPSSVRKVVEPETDLSVEYAHVKKDLMRIAAFSTLIFGIMFALKFAGF